MDPWRPPIVELDRESRRIQVRRAALGERDRHDDRVVRLLPLQHGRRAGFPAPVLPRISAYAGAMQSFATYAVGFAARPVGAAIFGHWGTGSGGRPR